MWMLLERQGIYRKSRHFGIALFHCFRLLSKWALNVITLYVFQIQKTFVDFEHPYFSYFHILNILNILLISFLKYFWHFENIIESSGSSQHDSSWYKNSTQSMNAIEGFVPLKTFLVFQFSNIAIFLVSWFVPSWKTKTKFDIEMNFEISDAKITWRISHSYFLISF